MACHAELNAAVGNRIWILHCDNVNHQVGSRSIRVCGSRAITWRTSRRSRIEIEMCCIPVNRRGPIFARKHAYERDCLHSMHSNKVADNELRIRYLQSSCKRERSRYCYLRSRKYVIGNISPASYEIISRTRRQKGWKTPNESATPIPPPPLFLSFDIFMLLLLVFLVYHPSNTANGLSF